MNDKLRYGVRFEQLEVGDTFYIAPLANESLMKTDLVRLVISTSDGKYSDKSNARWKSSTLYIPNGQMVWVDEKTIKSVAENEQDSNDQI